MTGRAMDIRTLAHEAIRDVRDCATQIGASAVQLQEQLPGLPMDETLRAASEALCVRLARLSVQAVVGLRELRDSAAAAEFDVSAVLKELSDREAMMMGVLARFGDLVDGLEQVAERDARCEPAFVLTIEVAGVLLQQFQKAKASTDALQAALDQA